MADYTTFIGNIVLAIILGGIIGLEREKQRKQAGLRTHVLVCVGAMLFTYIGISAYNITDPTARIVSGIITGIGFLGAGSIIISKEKVKGLTTAAGIWVVAAIGIGVAYGYYMIVIITTLFVTLVLWFNDYWLVQKIEGK